MDLLGSNNDSFIAFLFSYRWYYYCNCIV
jgi:hypothetical protein